MLNEKLEGVGLNEKEVKIYLALLELGQTTVQIIAKKANINRATAYFIIESLMKKGLAASFNQGKKQFFIGSSPEKLRDILKKQIEEVKKREAELEEILPELNSINNQIKGKPVVKYYEGKEGIKTMVAEVFNKPGDTILMAYSADAIEDFFTPKEREEWTKLREEKKIINKVIYTSDRITLPQVSWSKRIKIPSDRFPITCDIAVYDNKIRLASLGGRLIGVIIEDEELAKSFKTIMELALEAAEKYQKE